MSKTSGESKNSSNPQLHESFVLGDYDPIVIEHGKNGRHTINVDD